MGGKYAFIACTAAFEVSDLQLKAPLKDAEALATVLADADVGFAVDEPALNLPVQETRLRLAHFFANRKHDDLLLLHISSHGLTDDRGELYIAATDTQPKGTELQATAVPASFLSRLMDDSRSRRIVLLLDCCHAAAFTRTLNVRGVGLANVRANFEGRGRAILTASDELGFAFEDADAESRPSLFTGAIVEGLAGFAADLNGDGRITVDELYDYARSCILDINPAQAPHKFVFVDGELVIAERLRAHPLAPLSGDALPDTPRRNAPPGPPSDPWVRLESELGTAARVATVRERLEGLRLVPASDAGGALCDLARELRSLGFLPQTEHVLRLVVSADFSPGTRAHAQLDLARTLELLNKIAQAIVAYREAANTSFDDVRHDAWKELGQLLERRNPEQAPKVYEDAVAAGLSEARLWLAEHYARAGRNEDAIAAYERIVADEGEVAGSIHLSLARLAAASGFIERAIAAFSYAADHGEPQARLELGELLEHLNRVEEAAAVYERAVADGRRAGLDLSRRATARKAKKARARLKR